MVLVFQKWRPPHCLLCISHAAPVPTVHLRLHCYPVYWRWVMFQTILVLASNLPFKISKRIPFYSFVLYWWSQHKKSQRTIVKVFTTLDSIRFDHQIGNLGSSRFLRSSCMGSTLKKRIRFQNTTGFRITTKVILREAAGRLCGFP